MEAVCKDQGLVNRCSKQLKDVINENQFFAISFFIFNAIDREIYVFFMSNIPKYEGVIYFFELCFVTMFLTLIVHLIRSYLIRKVIQYLVLFINGTIFIIESFNLVYSKNLLNAGSMNVLMDTNFKEALDFMRISMGKELILIILLILSVKLIAYSNKVLQIQKLAAAKILLVIFFVGFILLVREECVPHQGFAMKELTPIQRVYSSMKMASEEKAEYNKFYQKINKKIVLTENRAEISNVVLIIGESTNRDHMGIYGCKLDTTPNLQKLKDEDQLYVYKDVISPHAHTIPVLQKLLTFCDFESDNKWYTYNNLIDVVNAAGYKSFWLSNQETSGCGGNPAPLFANCATQKYYTQIRDDVIDNNSLDENLLPLIEKAQGESGEKNFYVVHLMGTHYAYRHLYPEAYDVFQAKDVAEIDGQRYLGNDKAIAEYDNAVLYNDFIIKQVINHFANSDAIIIYLSDHGEEVYDYRDFCGHAEDNFSRFMIEIPFMVWTSDTFKTKHSNIDRKFKLAVDRPYMTDDLIHTILDCMQIKTEDYDSSRSIINEDFRQDRKRMFHGEDYDTQIKSSDLK